MFDNKNYVIRLYYFEMSEADVNRAKEVINEINILMKIKH